MSALHFCSVAAALAVLSCAAGPANADPLVITLPSRMISTPQIAASALPLLLGKWHDGSCLFLPPGITPFETVSDTLTFHANGTFTQTIEKATGRLRTGGNYTVAGTRLTLSFLLGTGSAQYEFSRIGDHLQLQLVKPGKSTVRTLSQVGIDI